MTNWALDNEIEKLIDGSKKELIEQQEELTNRKQTDSLNFAKKFKENKLNQKTLEANQKKNSVCEPNSDQMKESYLCKFKLSNKLNAVLSDSDERSDIINLIINNHLKRVILIRDELARRRSFLKNDYKGTAPPGLHDEPYL